MPFAGWLNDRLQRENIEKEMSYVEIDSKGRLYEVLVSCLVSQVKESSCKIACKDNVSPATKALEKLARVAKQTCNHKEELTQKQNEIFFF